MKIESTNDRMALPDTDPSKAREEAMLAIHYPKKVLLRATASATSSETSGEAADLSGKNSDPNSW